MYNTNVNYGLWVMSFQCRFIDGNKCTIVMGGRGGREAGASVGGGGGREAGTERGLT